jgi:hypothetical protein
MPYHALSRLVSLEPLLFAVQADDLFLEEDRVRAVGYEGTKRGRVVGARTALLALLHKQFCNVNNVSLVINTETREYALHDHLFKHREGEQCKAQ